MIIPERKKAAGVILSKYKPDGSYADGGTVKSEEQVMPDMAAFHAHAESILSAVHNKSPGELVQAMKNFLAEHEAHSDKEDEEPSDYSPERE